MTATRETVKTSILILSDTHASDLSRERHEAICCCPPFPKVDIALHCGDLTRAGRLKEHEKTIELLASIDAEYKFVIAGNHDLSLDENYMRHHRLRLLTQRDTEITACATIWKSDETKRKGIRYLDEGIHAFQLKNGAMLNVRPIDDDDDDDDDDNNNNNNKDDVIILIVVFIVVIYYGRTSNG